MTCDLSRRTPLGVILALLGLVAAGCGPPAARQVELVDLHGVLRNPLAGSQRATVLVFVRADCPISNRYAPELARLHETFAGRGVAFYLVYADAARAPEEIRHHREEYGLRMPALLDPEHAMVGASGATVTPEAAVFDRAGRLVYRGRIDDTWLSFSDRRRAPTRHDLARALEDLLAGREVAVRRTRAVGCYLEDLKPS